MPFKEKKQSHFCQFTLQSIINRTKMRCIHQRKESKSHEQKAWNHQLRIMPASKNQISAQTPTNWDTSSFFDKKAISLFLSVSAFATTSELHLELQRTCKKHDLRLYREAESETKPDQPEQPRTTPPTFQGIQGKHVSIHYHRKTWI